MMIIVLSLLGLCLGSFANALVWRVHEQSLSKHKRKERELSITKGRSMCTNCRHILAWNDLLPVVSWLSLGGKCRYCHKSISAQYPIVEVLTAVLFVISYVAWPFDFDVTGIILFSLWLPSVVMMVALGVYDLKWMLLPDRLTKPFIVLSLFIAMIHIFSSDEPLNSIIMILGSLAVASGLFYILHIVSDGEWIGGGDVKLGIGIGFLLASPMMSALMIFVASFLGCIVSIPLLFQKHTARIKIPFGPFLLMATFLVFLYGQNLIDWYNELLII